MMSNFRVKSLNDQVDAQTQRAEKSEAIVAELELREAANGTQRQVMQAAITEAREESRERWGLLCEERSRVADLEGREVALQKFIDENPHYRRSYEKMRDRTEELIGIEERLKSRVEELEHSLSDAMEQLAAIQGTSQAHIDRVAELEAKLAQAQFNHEHASQERAEAREELGESQARVAELVESEEKAWQTVAKLRVELETTNRLRARVAALESNPQEYSQAWHFPSEVMTPLAQALDRVAELVKMGDAVAESYQAEMRLTAGLREVIIERETRVAELERDIVDRKLPKVWSLEIAGREVVLRFENGRMSACATMKGDDEPESFVLKRDGLERIDGWPEHPESDPIDEGAEHFGVKEFPGGFKRPDQSGEGGS